MRINPSSRALGAMVEDIDLSQPLSDATFALLKHAVGKHGVLWYPRQRVEATQPRNFAGLFGTLEINVANSHQEPGIPEVIVFRTSFATASQSGWWMPATVDTRTCRIAA
ncbi:hypothetical protein [Paraburkholderia aspalathi]|uniref:Taurine dioxygenase n=1 Tax=Paraburkholderia aspalathi TaxID=1324617 RepID=A0A1I7ERL5_9BURK|nr:hypothetical protein [Paraburkholderia aspalathi]SFU26578.1 taurine dioxygenase [Paraburkholderia aspalathi]